MSSFLSTFAAAFLLILFALFGLAIGWLLVGKKLKRGCGKDPNKFRDESCGKNDSCTLCRPEKKEEK